MYWYMYLLFQIHMYIKIVLKKKNWTSSRYTILWVKLYYYYIRCIKYLYTIRINIYGLSVTWWHSNRSLIYSNTFIVGTCIVWSYLSVDYFLYFKHCPIFRFKVIIVVEFAFIVFEHCKQTNKIILWNIKLSSPYL